MEIQLILQNPIISSVIATSIYDVAKYLYKKGTNSFKKRFRNYVKDEIEEALSKLEPEKLKEIKPIIEDENKKKALDKILEKVEPKVIEYVEKKNSIDGLKEYVESLLKSEEFLKELGSELNLTKVEKAEKSIIVNKNEGEIKQINIEKVDNLNL